MSNLLCSSGARLRTIPIATQTCCGRGSKSLHLGQTTTRRSRKIRYHLQSDLTPWAPLSVARPISSSFHSLSDRWKGHSVGTYRHTTPTPTLVLVNFTPYGTVPQSVWIRYFHGDVPQQGGKAESKVEQSVKALKEKKKQKSGVSLSEPPFVTSPTGKDLTVPRKSLWVRFVEEVKHYYHGFRLLFLDFKVAARLFFKMWKGISLTRREYRQFTRTVADLGRIVPFSLFLIIPMAEILLPFYVKLFPGLMPSTFEDKKMKDERLRKQLRTRLDTARFLLKTMEELPVETRRRSSGRKSVEDFIQFMDRLRQSGEPAPTEEILKYSKLFEDEMTLDNMEHPSLVALCKLLQLQPIGTNNFLRFQLRMRLRTIKADDKMIQRDGINTLTANELQVACRARGMRALGMSEDRMRFQLSQWLDLHLNEEVPTSLLLLSRVLYLPDNLPATDQLQATLSVLPESIEKTARLKIAEAEGAVDNKTKLDVIRAEEKAIQKELEERKAEEMERLEQERKKAEAEAQKAQEAAEKEQLVDNAPPVQTEEQIVAETIVDKAPEVKTEKDEKVLDTDLEEISAAVKKLAAEKDTLVTTLERDEFNDLKEEYEEFRQDEKNLHKVASRTGEPLSIPKSTRRLKRVVMRMFDRIENTIMELENRKEQVEVQLELDKEKVQLMEGGENTPILDRIQTEKCWAIPSCTANHKHTRECLVTLDELVEVLKKIKNIDTKDMASDQKLEHIAQMLDDDHDGQIRLNEVNKAIQMILEEDVDLTESQLREVVKLLHAEEDLEEKEDQERERLEKEKELWDQQQPREEQKQN
ncbi:PREDICTED: LETM1 and EF-hand domain-containing protein 1, mitochondrial-like isoform X2 [Branchiostoma belcheri]|uniref:Mitochondrial proton/calcium exchanger protein n=1 Tax=Branchiostoma belcheri TaxID=7741 RepID=A0A6P4Z400_BRABE|nr:PREDICTED: LETM1 and EF-hand domain-containing protein 1, mitochondrial-like isoform X2 [Branchiostoma belcheri]